MGVGWVLLTGATLIWRVCRGSSHAGEVLVYVVLWLEVVAVEMETGEQCLAPRRRFMPCMMECRNDEVL